MTNEKAPERIIICIDGYKPAIADWAKDRMKECDIEYVRADLLATVRKEEREAAFKEATKIVKTQPSTIGDWMTQADVAANLRRKIVWAFERALTEK